MGGWDLGNGSSLQQDDTVDSGASDGQSDTSQHTCYVKQHFTFMATYNSSENKQTNNTHKYKPQDDP